ncbi:MAG: twin-arginine translocase subunit TatC, partial [Gammaproteobacteria bacterium]|nr:twin-arginine translocase subunit TatC [Gammaproteobacteria bacterium]
LVFGFLTGIVPTGVEMMTDISRYLDFVLKMFFAFGFAFEVPIATILVIWTGLATAQSLAQKRPYIIVAAFVIGMLLTPPDVISQTLLALPMWILFELGLIMSRLYTKPQQESDDTVAAAVAGNAMTTPNVDDLSENLVVDESATDDADNEEYRELSDEEMDAELDRIEAEDDAWDDEPAEEPHQEYEPLPENMADADADADKNTETDKNTDKNGDGTDAPKTN